MYSFLRRGALAAAIATAALTGAAWANIGEFIGSWNNVDSGTRDITRVVVSPAGAGEVTVQAFGRCHPQDCDWGVVPGHGFADNVGSNDIRVVKARFNAGFKHTDLTLRLTPNGLRYQILTTFTDNSGRSDYEAEGMLRRFQVGPMGPIGPGPGPMNPGGFHPLPVQVLGPEDCIPFNPNQVMAKPVNGSWKVVQGSMWMLDFGGNMAGAQRAAWLVHRYNFNQQCFVRRPHPPMMYWKSGGGIPSAGAPGEDCTNNNPATTAVANVGGAWKVVDGSHWMLDFGPDQAAANQAVAVIKHYHLNRQCFVGRPNPPMSYWLAQ